MIQILEKYVGVNLFSDMDLHGGGWHIHDEEINLPKGIYRKILAIYYLTEPKQCQLHQRAVYAHRDNQKNDKKVQKEIELPQDSQCYTKAYKLK